jgi:hypothetical protein
VLGRRGWRGYDKSVCKFEEGAGFKEIGIKRILWCLEDFK